MLSVNILFWHEMKIQTVICMVLFYGCDATINITEGDEIYFETDTKLSITCTNDVDSFIDFKFKMNQLVLCESSGCSITDNAFSAGYSYVSQHHQYVLQSVDNFNAALCGVYECVNVSNAFKDSVNVILKEFDNNTYYADEKDDQLSITTTCMIPSSVEDMEINWYIYDNTSSLLLSSLSIENDIALFNTSSVCSNITCDTTPAKSFTFGLTFTEPTGTYSNVYVELEVIHRSFPAKPLTWRSSTTFPIKEIEEIEGGTSNPKSDKKTGAFIGRIVGGVFGVIFIVIFIVISIFVIKWICHRKKGNTNRNNEETLTKQVLPTDQSPSEKKITEGKPQYKAEAVIETTAEVELITTTEQNRAEQIKITAFGENTLFATLSKKSKRRLARAAFLVKVKQIKDLKQAETPSAFYIVVSESVTINGKKINMNSGFGKISVIYGIGNTEKFKKMIQTTTKDDHYIYALPDRIEFTECNAELLGLARKDYDDILMSRDDWKFILYGELLRTIIKDNYWSMLPKIAPALRPRVLDDKHPIVTEDERGKRLFILIQGQDTDVDHETRRFYVFGTDGFSYPAIATLPVLCVVLDYATIKQLGTWKQILKPEHSAWTRHGQFAIHEHIENLTE